MEYKELCSIFGGEKTPFERDSLVSICQSRPDAGDHCRIIIVTTSACNYDCHYCSKPEGSKRMTFETFKTFVDNYLDKIPFGHILFYYFGGEPTINPDTEKMVDYLGAQKDKRVTQVIQSNGSADHEMTERYAKKDFDLNISLSYHPTILAEDKEAQKHFIQNARILSKYEKTNGMLLMIPDDKYLKHLDGIHMLLKALSRKSNLIEFFPIFQTCNDLSDEAKSRFNIDQATNVNIGYEEEGELKNAPMSLEDMMAKRMFHYEGMSCDPGHIVLDSDGKYYKCFASQYQRKECIGHIEDGNYEAFNSLMTKANICKHPVCLADLSTIKRKVNE